MLKFLAGFSVITCHLRTTLIYAFVIAIALSPSVKAYLWKSIGTPSLMYAIGTCNISSVDLKRLESFQGTTIKYSVYLGKRCHQSALLEALNILEIKYRFFKQRIGLLKRVWNVITPYTKLGIELLALYIANGIIVKGTLVGQLVENGISPQETILTQMLFTRDQAITWTLVWWILFVM